MEVLLNKIRNLKIAVIGDMMLDHYIWGDAERISPEAPVPVIDVKRDTYVPGGAANVALNAVTLGASVEVFGSIANDDAGEQLRAKLHESNVWFDPRFARNLAPTIVKTRVIVRNQQLCRLDREVAPHSYAIEDENLLKVLEERIKHVNAVILSDYYKGVITDELIERVKKITKERGIFFAIDPKPKRPIKFTDVDLLTPNRFEALTLSKIEVIPHQKFPAVEVCKALWEKYRPKNLAVTLGADGMVLSENGSNVKFIPTVAREVYDVSGAGDTVTAALTLALCGGASLEEGARFANIAAGVVVGKIGTATVKPEEMLAYTNIETPIFL